MIGLQQIINSSLSLRIVSTLAPRLSPLVGYRIACWVADAIARRKNSALVQAVRLNQWMATGGALPGQALDWVVRRTLHHWARCIFDLYHYVDHPEATESLVVLEPSFQPYLHRPEFERRGKRHGLVIVGLHLSNFDLILQWLCKQGMKPLVLTIPEPQGGRHMEYEMRRRTGMNLVPVSVHSLRQAIKYLQQGGMVVTGIDRPISEPELYPHFFGRPAALPVHHVFLAMKANASLSVAAVNFQKDEKYHVLASDLIKMDSYSDPKRGMLHNAEKVLATAENFIRQYPQQWSVPLPVWPQVMDLVPK